MRRLSGTVAAVSFCLTKPFSVPYFREQYSKMVDEQVFYMVYYILFSEKTQQLNIRNETQGSRRKGLRLRRSIAAYACGTEKADIQGF